MQEQERDVQCLEVPLCAANMEYYSLIYLYLFGPFAGNTPVNREPTMDPIHSKIPAISWAGNRINSCSNLYI